MQKALFEGLVFDENGDPAETVAIGGTSHYVIDDAGFKHHVESEYVDRQVLAWLQEEVQAHQEILTQSLLTLLGKDDLFTKAMIDSSISNIDNLLVQGLPDDARTWLGMMGFRIIVDVHGDVIRIESPEPPSE